MKIKFLPRIQFNTYSNYSKVPAEKAPDLPEAINSPAFGYYLPVNFKSLQLDKKFENVNDLHCPICGKKMLTDQKYQQIIEESRNVKNSQDFYNLLESYKDYIPQYYSKINKHVDSFLNREDDDKSIEALFGALFYISNSRYKTYLKRTAEDIAMFKNYGGVSKHDEKILDECITELNKPYLTQTVCKTKYSEYKSFLNEKWGQLESKDKWSVYNKAKEKIRDGALYAWLFRFNMRDANGELKENIVEEMTKAIFFPSLRKQSNIVPIWKGDATEDLNAILICDGCDNNNRYVFEAWKNHPERIQNILMYYEDVAKSINNKDTDLDYKFVLKQIDIIKLLSRDNILVDREYIRQLMKKNIFEDRHNRMDFEIAEFEGIPCACCGATTITHKQRSEIFSLIENAASQKEVFDIVEKYKKYLKPKYIEIIDSYKYIFKKYPNMSQDKIFEILRSGFKDKMDIAMLETIDEINSEALHMHLNEDDKKNLKRFCAKAKSDFMNMDYQSRFPYDEYVNMVLNTIGKMSSTNKYVLIDIAKEKVMNIYSLQNVLYIHPNILAKMSPLRGMVENMFKSVVITGDHMIPKNKNGWDVKSNIVGFCKTCNTKKSDMSLKDFYRYNPQLKVNFQKYLNKVVELIKSGQLKGYDDYPVRFAANVKNLTKGKNEIVLQFKPSPKRKK